MSPPALAGNGRYARGLRRRPDHTQPHLLGDIAAGRPEIGSLPVTGPGQRGRADNRRYARQPGRYGSRSAPDRTAVLYWNSPFGPVSWRRAERRLLSLWSSSGAMQGEVQQPSLAAAGRTLSAIEHAYGQVPTIEEMFAAVRRDSGAYESLLREIGIATRQPEEALVAAGIPPVRADSLAAGDDIASLRVDNPSLQVRFRQQLGAELLVAEEAVRQLRRCLRVFP
jgi:hypothetical protein